MNEIEYRVERAKRYRQYLDFDEEGIYEHWKWCVHIGLWETSGWIRNNEDGLATLNWVKPGQQEE